MSSDKAFPYEFNRIELNDFVYFVYHHIVSDSQALSELVQPGSEILG